MLSNPYAESSGGSSDETSALMSSASRSSIAFAYPRGSADGPPDARGSATRTPRDPALPRGTGGTRSARPARGGGRPGAASRPPAPSGRPSPRPPRSPARWQGPACRARDRRSWSARCGRSRGTGLPARAAGWEPRSPARLAAPLRRALWPPRGSDRRRGELLSGACQGICYFAAAPDVPAASRFVFGTPEYFPGTCGGWT